MGAARKRRWATPKPEPIAPAAPKLKLVKSVEDPAVEQRLSRALVEACVKLREPNGERFRKPKSKDQPHQVLDELDIMLERGEISRVQFDAGRRYGGRYREAMFRGVYRSSLRQNDRSRTGANYDAVLLDRLSVFWKLHADRQRAFGNNRRAVALCDALLGEDYRIDGGASQRAQLVEFMRWALTRLAYNYGLLWW